MVGGRWSFIVVVNSLRLKATDQDEISDGKDAEVAENVLKVK